MPRGGYRPGSGRKKGKDRDRQAEADKIRKMLTYGTKAKARFYQEFLLRVSKGEKLTTSEKKMMEKLGVELAEEIREEDKNGKVIEDLTPLDYMLRVMNDPEEDKEMRARMAIAAAPYIHHRKGEGVGKKGEQEERAKAAGAGKFAAGKAPLKVVK